MNRKRILKIGLPLLGALAGFLYWYKVGCLSGTCPLWSNPYISTVYGAVFGFLLNGVFSSSSKKVAASQQGNSQQDPNQAS